MMMCVFFSLHSRIFIHFAHFKQSVELTLQVIIITEYSFNC